MRPKFYRIYKYNTYAPNFLSTWSDTPRRSYSRLARPLREDPHSTLRALYPANGVLDGPGAGSNQHVQRFNFPLKESRILRM